MKRGEKVIFGIAIALGIAAVLQAYVRFSGPAEPRPPKDYTTWTDAAEAGYALYKKQSCNSCHRVLRMGQEGVAPVLDGEGTRRSVEWLQAYFTNPESLVPGTAHDGHLGPDFRALSESERDIYVAFMANLKSNPGSANYPVPPAQRTGTNRNRP